jgi:ABC-type transport system involved in multi-copper enzyme maturation permease subunit
VIARFLAIPLLELSTFWKRPLNIIMLVVFGLMSFGFVAGGVQLSTGSADTGGAKVSINSAFNLGFADMALFALILPFFVAVACGTPVLGDFDRKINRLVAATPLSHIEYAFARFLGAFAVLAVIGAAWMLLQIGFYELIPLDPTERIRGAFALSHYLLPKALFALPLALFVGGISMWLGVRTRQPVLVFALPVVVVVSGIFFVWTFNPEWLPMWVNRAMQLADPTGFRWFSRNFISEDRGVAFYNSASLVPDAAFLASRIALCLIGLGAVWATGRRLARTEHDDLRVGAVEALLAQARLADAQAVKAEHAAIAARGGAPASSSKAPGFVRGMIDIARLETRTLLRSPGVWLFGPLILIQAWAATSFRQGPLDTELLMTTGAAAASVFDTLTLLLCFLVLFYTVESLVREERCGLSGIFRAAPVPTASVLAGKVLANAAMALVIIGCAALAIAMVLGKQAIDTGILVEFDVPVLFLILGVLLAPTLIVWGAFVSFLYALLRNRFVVYGVALGALVGTGFATQFGYLNWVTKWHMWSSVQWSELDGLAFMWPAIATNRLLVLSLAAFFIVATLSMWPRRLPDLRAVADRMKPAAFLRAAIVPVLAALPVAGIATFAGLSVRSGYEGAPQREAQKAYWKRNSKTWEEVPVPALDKVDGEVKLFPETRSLEVAATYVLRNPHARPMAEVPITVGSHFETSDWTVDGVATDPAKQDQPRPSIENRSGLHVITPAKPLSRDATVTISFKMKGEFPKGWSRTGAGTGEFILPSGVVLTSFSPSFLPVVGFVESVGVDGENRRDAREYPLDHWKTRVDPAFGPAWATQVRLAVEGPEGWKLNVVGVEKESTVADGRRRTVWETEHPVRFFNIVGGPLEEKTGDAATVYYSARTPHNVDTMVKALSAARKSYAAWFGPYPWENLRVTQFPGLAGYAQGFPGNISFSEGIGYMSRPVAKGADGYLEQEGALDVAFYIVAHEAGHQWWGNIVMPGKGPGGNIISEGLAEFSALMLLHHECGDDQAKTLRRRWEKAYTEGRRADNERSINRTDGTRPGDQVVTYNRAGFVFWMLRDLMGEEQMLAGLKAFVAKWRNGVETPDGLDFPLIEDMVESLRPFAPDEVAFGVFVDQWIYGTALPELELGDAKVDGSDGAFTTAVELRNIGKGTVDVTVRVVGEDPAQHEDTVVRVAPNAPAPVSVSSSFKPAKIVVDPDVKLLFAGRKRCEKSL